METWKKAIDNKKIRGSIWTDLSKAFDCLNHDLLVAKLNQYGFGKNALKCIHSYLRERKQMTKVKYSYTFWRELLYGVPQRSILGPLLFNIIINNTSYLIDKANPSYATEDNLENLWKVFETETSSIGFETMKWNQTMANDIFLCLSQMMSW